MVKSQFWCHAKIIQTDNGWEFISRHIRLFYLNNSSLDQTLYVGVLILHNKMYILSEEHNHILNIARVLRLQSRLPLKFRGECV